ncbi:MAG: DUF87 domain-containing protein [Saccharofermentanales bacterium]
MQAYEILGHFYLGKTVDPMTMTRSEQYLMYDSKDLNTHAICVGMTGSGKTGLGIGILEEAAMDNIPALIIDPKGDMTNLMLTFPDLLPEDFLPWLHASDAERKGLTLEEFAKTKADSWRNGLAEWSQDGERIRVLCGKADFSVYTPGSSAGKPLSIIRMLETPAQMIPQDQEALQDYISATVSALLALLGIDADPLQSREHILLSNILLNNWRNGLSLNLETLIQLIAQPGIAQIGVMPLDTFYPQNDRMQLAMRFNNLLASPQFSSWLQGEPLDIHNLLYTAEGKPRISILALSHLDEEQRMFFVSTFLNQVLVWIRTQSGTSSLRALLYMDEIFGYFPPVANPPSKKPLLSLLKQARAYGLGIVLATQNPVDLDYKGLSNIGTWFIGRLQTEQDKERLLDGLQTAVQSNSQSALNFNRKEISDLLSGLPARTFLMNNVHEPGPVLFETRWCMSYLAGPLTRQQIALIEQEKIKPAETVFTESSAPADADASSPADHVAAAGTVAGSAAAGAVAGSAAAGAVASSAVAGAVAGSAGESFATAGLSGTSSGKTSQTISETAQMPQTAEPAQLQSESQTSNSFNIAPELPAGVEQYYFPPQETSSDLIFVPSIYGYLETVFEDAKYNVSATQTGAWNTLIEDRALAVDWSNPTGALPEPNSLELSPPVGNISYAKLPAVAAKKSSFTQWSEELVDYVFRNSSIILLANQDRSVVSGKDETKADFLIRLRQANREARDQAMADLKEKYDKKIAVVTEKVRKAEQVVERKEDQAKQAKFSSVVNIGNTVLSTFFGRRGIGKGTVGKAATSARSLGRANQVSSEVARAEETLATYQADLENLETELEKELELLAESFAAQAEAYEEIKIKPKKKDIFVKVFGLLWLPYENQNNQLRPLFEIIEKDDCF